MTKPSADQPAGVVELGGALYMRDAKGSMVPIELVKEQHKLQDQTVRAIFTKARELAAAIAAFREQAFSDVDAMNQLLEQQYGAKAGGAKGNMTLTSFDGLLKVQVQVADLIRFGPELQVAKTIVDECVAEWSDGARAELRAIVMRAFNVDKEGQVNRGELLSLLRLEIEDPRWKKAMEALKDSMQVVGSKRYVRFYEKKDIQAPWIPVSLDVASS
jgi:hypothetical protein